MASRLLLAAVALLLCGFTPPAPWGAVQQDSATSYTTCPGCALGETNYGFDAGPFPSSMIVRGVGGAAEVLDSAVFLSSPATTWDAGAFTSHRQGRGWKGTFAGTASGWTATGTVELDYQGLMVVSVELLKVGNGTDSVVLDVPMIDTEATYYAMAERFNGSTPPEQYRMTRQYLDQDAGRVSADAPVSASLRSAVSMHSAARGLEVWVLDGVNDRCAGGNIGTGDLSAETPLAITTETGVHRLQMTFGDGCTFVDGDRFNLRLAFAPLPSTPQGADDRTKRLTSTTALVPLMRSDIDTDWGRLDTSANGNAPTVSGIVHRRPSVIDYDPATVEAWTIANPGIRAVLYSAIQRSDQGDQVFWDNAADWRCNPAAMCGLTNCSGVGEGTQSFLRRWFWSIGTTTPWGVENQTTDYFMCGHGAYQHKLSNLRGMFTSWDFKPHGLYFDHADTARLDVTAADLIFPASANNGRWLAEDLVTNHDFLGGVFDIVQGLEIHCHPDTLPLFRPYCTRTWIGEALGKYVLGDPVDYTSDVSVDWWKAMLWPKGNRVGILPACKGATNEPDCVDQVIGLGAALDAPVWLAVLSDTISTVQDAVDRIEFFGSLLDTKVYSYTSDNYPSLVAVSDSGLTATVYERSQDPTPANYLDGMVAVINGSGGVINPASVTLDIAGLELDKPGIVDQFCLASDDCSSGGAGWTALTGAGVDTVEFGSLAASAASQAYLRVSPFVYTPVSVSAGTDPGTAIEDFGFHVTDAAVSSGGDPLGYYWNWLQTGGPGTCTFYPHDEWQDPEINCDTVGSYDFLVALVDTLAFPAAGSLDSDTVTVSVASGAPAAPTADAGADPGGATVGVNFQLDGTATPPGSTILWTQTVGDTCSIPNANIETPTVNCPTAETVTFNMNVSNISGSDDDTVDVVVAAAPTGFTLTINASRTTCVAPCSIHFEGYKSSTSTRPFRTTSWLWDFDDPTSGSWLYGEETSKNEARTPQTMHLFESPGTYDVTATGWDNETGSSAVGSKQVVVTAFSGTTICVSASGTFDHCTGTNHTSNDFDAEVNALGANERIIFRSGESYESSTQASAKNGQKILCNGPSGDCDVDMTVNGHTVLNLPGSLSQVYFGRGTQRFSVLGHLYSNGNGGLVKCETDAHEHISVVGIDTLDVWVPVRCFMSEFFNGQGHATGAKKKPPKAMYIAELDLENTSNAASTAGQYAVNILFEDSGFFGNKMLFSNTSHGNDFIRSPGQFGMVYTNNYTVGGRLAGSFWKIHAATWLEPCYTINTTGNECPYGYTGSGVGTSLYGKTRYVNIRDNVFEKVSGGNPYFIEYTSQNGTSNEELELVNIKRNRMIVGAGSTCPGCTAVVTSADKATIAENVLVNYANNDLKGFQFAHRGTGPGGGTDGVCAHNVVVNTQTGKDVTWACGGGQITEVTGVLAVACGGGGATVNHGGTGFPLDEGNTNSTSATDLVGDCTPSDFADFALDTPNTAVSLLTKFLRFDAANVVRTSPTSSGAYD